MDVKQFPSISDSVTMSLNESENAAVEVNYNGSNIDFEKDGNDATNKGGVVMLICVLKERF